MGLKKLGKFIKKVIKPVAVVASIVYPPLIPLIGTTLGATSAASAAIVGAAALSGGASAIAGDKPSDIIKNAALGGLVGGTVQAVAPNAFTSGGLLGGGTSAATSAGTTAATEGVAGGLMGSTLPVGAGAGGTQAVAASTLGSTAAQYLTSPAGVSAATQVASDVASKGLIGDVLTKASQLTGLSEGTLGQLGSAGVQALLSGYAASKTADTQRQAAQTAADAQIEAARIAAEAARFRPVGVTTRFGSSNFGFDAEGNVISAGYTPSAEITGYQDRLRTLAGQGMTDIEGARAAYQPLTGAAQSLFSLGNQYLAKSPEQAAQDYITKQQALITPSRQTQLAEVQNRLFQQGRGGAATAQGGNLMATSPELAAYYNALAQQDLVLAAEADQAAQQRLQFGAGLFDTGANLQGRYYTGQTAAYAPFATAMNTSSELESLAERPLGLGVELGGRVSSAAGRAGALMGQGILGAAETMYPSNAYSLTGDVLSGISQSPLVTSAIDRAFGVQPDRKTIFGT